MLEFLICVRDTSEELFTRPAWLSGNIEASDDCDMYFGGLDLKDVPHKRTPNYLFP